MEINLSNLHFLRPAWLLLGLFAAFLPLLWRCGRDLQRRLRGQIAEHLLAHLLVTPEDHQRLRPVHGLCALLMLGALAAAGPTWEQDRPDFLENRAPLIVAVDLSPSMDASDVQPTRLEAVKHKLHDLIQHRAGARTALIAYAGSAHLVLPATDDPALLDTFIQALNTGLIDKPGKNVGAVIEQAKRLVDAEKTPGTLLLLTDGADIAQLGDLDQRLRGSTLQVLVLAVGSVDGGVIQGANGQPRSDGNGRPVLGSFDQAALKQLASAVDAPLGSLTLNNDDLDWIELHAQRHFQTSSAEQRELHWKDAGYWLCWPLLLLALFNVRRGWSVNWLPALLLAAGLGWPAAPAQANALTDAFFTRDQQGRWAFEHDHLPQAAALFVDPYWKGVAAYHAADYDLALATFARLDTPQAYFYLGNIYVRRFRFDQAIAAYTQALKLQPQFPEATANLALAQALLKDTESAEQNVPETKPDEVKFDKAPGKGQSKAIKTEQAASDALWLHNLTTSPAKFLRQKFRLQDQQEARP
ncbi:VWA domain-containing protein [Pseudomonas granadensis]|uniref:VWA domain-containing protein n=1 Tax=Pseudomonas granadensis TaxID=1421430 RepID=UPI0019CF9AFC|nr:VWA domain-containing protein [Pseudomonas granadensis]MBN6776547.1 VWA domain-containing protein [Pseudomonas granadensis]MBN6807718.1 VWA domain-containing protein [Pseudomonas granadensis]MBN6834501.1 VWA domain-containing protein [Pseudomonas granadensis]MBN6842014.1 VWA domain-containing protein [Pseudomonas granadensis]MBN6870686.1 VWA domain-containing protein [Pseudomonas granadensis]